MSNGFLSKAYSARDAASTQQLYDEWSASYEAEVRENGYATPGRSAEALAAHLSDLSQPVLDFGCGTGLSGLALKLTGFDVIDGLDISEDMLRIARGKGLYRNLSLISAGATPPHQPGAYAAIAAVGVIGSGAAPIDVFDTLMGGLAPGGLLVLSFNDHALEDPIHEDRLDRWIADGKATLRFKEYGPHLPGIGLKSNVYIVEKK